MGLRGETTDSECAKSGTSNVSSDRALLITSGRAPGCSQDLSDRDGSRCKESRAGGSEPEWAALRSEREGPRIVKSSAKGDEPRRSSPETKAAGPVQRELLRGKGGSSFRKSKANETTSRRAGLRAGSKRPKCTLSVTDGGDTKSARVEPGASSVKPEQQKPLSGINGPGVAKFVAGTLAPGQE